MSNIKVIEVKTYDLRDPETAEQLGQAILSAIDQSKSARKIPDELKTALDDADIDAIRSIKETAEYKAFHKGLRQRIEELVDYVDSHRKAYNCDILISSISISGATAHSGAVCYAGRGDSIQEALDEILDDNDLSEMLESMLAKRRLIAQLQQAAATPASETLIPENESSTPENS